MEIDKKTLENIAHLARLEFNPQSEEAMRKDLNKILDWMEQLSQLDTSAVEPLIHMSAEINRLREDSTGISLPHEQALVNAPNKDSNYFRVPKVIE